MISTEPGLRCGNTGHSVLVLNGRGGLSVHGAFPFSENVLRQILDMMFLKRSYLHLLLILILEVSGSVMAVVKTIFV